jgi:hypothetical protein
MPQFPIKDEGPCEHFDTKYIEYPLTIEGIDNQFNKNLFNMHQCGTLVRVSPCGEEYQGKTYLGVLLGDLPIGAFISFNRESKMLDVFPHSNPAIFVPEIKRIIYGCESWWAEVKNEDDLTRDITSEDIQGTWYVRLLKEMLEKQNDQPANPTKERE